MVDVPCGTFTGHIHVLASTILHTTTTETHNESDCMKFIILSIMLAVLPPQKMSPRIQVVVAPQPHTNLCLYWAQNYDPGYLWTEVWHSPDLVHWNIYQQCPITNNILIPMTNWYTNTFPLYDTNGNQVGLGTNGVNMDFFQTVDVEMWSRRFTNETWTYVP